MSHSAWESLQQGRFLAEVDFVPEERLLSITLAGPAGVVVFDLAGVAALAVAHESLDPEVPPSALTPDARLLSSRLAAWEPADVLDARLGWLTTEAVDDVAAASTVSWIAGDREGLDAAGHRLGLRVEAFALEPRRVDLVLLVGCEDLRVYTEDGEVAWEMPADEVEPAGAPPAAHRPPEEPAWEVLDHDLPPELETPVRRFFTAHHAGDWRELAAVHPSPDRDAAAQAASLRAHFHDIWEWGYARAVESWWRERDLACVTIRGIHHSAPDEALPARNEECVWAFSLRRRRSGDWIVRHWSQAWPALDARLARPAAEKPWLTRWGGGPVE